VAMSLKTLETRAVSDLKAVTEMERVDALSS